MIQTPVTELLGIEHPIIQGGMAWLANANLASAVSNGGGLGLIGSASADADTVRTIVRRTKELTAKPFGLNIMLMNPHAADLAQLCIDEKIPVVTTGAGNPGQYIAAWKTAGIKVIPVVPSVALAVRMERAGADAVVAEGGEAGGHIGDMNTMALVPQVAQAIQIPVIAAGGIADGRGVAAAFMLGAKAVQMGTVFICACESPAHEEYKKMVVEAGDTGTTVTGRSTGHPVRCLKNRLSRRIVELEKNGAPVEEIEKQTVGSYRRAIEQGDLKEGTFMAGQSAGLVCSVRPAQEIIKTVMKQAQQCLLNFQQGGVRIV